MIRAGLLLLAMLLTGLVWQSMRLEHIRQQNRTQKQAITLLEKRLNQTNSQLLALDILAQRHSRAQVQLYAAAEQNSALLRTRQRQFEELKGENTDLYRWSAAPLPDAVIRLRNRPALTGGESYRQWLSQNHPLPASPVSPPH